MAFDRSESVSMSRRTSFRRRFRLIYLAPVLAFIALSAWAFASPIGSSPDDDYHLASIWCSTGDENYCQPGSTEATRLVPQVLLDSRCYAFYSERSADCLYALDFESNEFVETKKGNFVGAYPPLYYSVMSIFVTADELSSVMVMRLFNIALFVGITVSLYMLLPRNRRPALVWGWLVTTLPLGVFLLASNNPSGWAITGVGSAWLALLSFYEARTTITRWASAALVVVSALMAAGSRGDSALYVVGAFGVAAILAFENTKQFWLRTLLPLSMVVCAAIFFFGAKQTSSGVSGFSGEEGGPVADTAVRVSDGFAGVGIFVYNLVNVPLLWVRSFGGWELGWLDVPTTAFAVFLGLAVFVGIGFAGIATSNIRKIIAVSVVFIVLWALPTYVLTVGGDKVGEQVQPRYILPLIVVFGGVLVFQAGKRYFSLGRVQTVAVVIALSTSNLIALHMNIRRYVTGITVQGWNLDSDAEWFWFGISPMAVWGIGSFAFAGMVAIVAREMYARATPTLEISSEEEPKVLVSQ